MTNNNGLNTKISANVLPDDSMRALGFTDHAETTWYYVTQVRKSITLNISISKDGARLKIDVLDEWFGQPYDYQHMLASSDNPPEAAKEVHEKVEKIMSEMVDAGVLAGWSPGQYI